MNRLLPWITAMLVTAAGCTSSGGSSAEEACPPPTSKRVEVAFEHSREVLAEADCRDAFEAHFAALLTLAEGDPGDHNRRRFSDFIGWAVEQGILSRVEAEMLYSRHFSTTLVSLPDDRSACASVGDLAMLQRSLDDELRDKHVGLYRVLGEPEAYAQVERQRRNVMDVFAALRIACQ